MKKIIYTLFLVLFFAAFGKSQEICWTMENLKLQIATNPGLQAEMKAYEEELQRTLASQGDMNKSTNATITIPVVVHIVYNTNAQNIPDERVIEQMSVLNDDYSGQTTHGNMGAFPSTLYANCGVQFCLAKRDPQGNPTSGIERRHTDSVVFKNLNNVKYTAMGGLDAWNVYKYLNIWVDTIGGGYLGFAQFPSQHLPITYGAVILYSAFGLSNTLPQYNWGSTTTHEIGHCFNCYHIWGDDGTACTGTDYCNDTPNQAGYTLDPHPDINGVIVDACTQTSPGIMYMDFMDYSRDIWKHNFTPDQKVRMQALFTKPHGLLYLLTQSDGCVPPPIVCSVPRNLNTTSITENTAILNWDAVPFAIIYNVQYRVVGGSWTIVSTALTSLPVMDLIAGTKYEWKVQTNCGNGNTSVYSTSITFTTLGICSNINAFEPNETQATAALIQTGVAIDAGIPSATDLDWFKFTNTNKNKNIKITLTNLSANYDVDLYNAAGTRLGISQNSGTADEIIIYNTTTVGTYYIKVYGFNGAFDPVHCYSLNATISSSNWKSSNVIETSPDPILDLIVFPNPSNSTFNFSLKTRSDELVTIQIFDMLGRLVNEYKSLSPDDVMTLKDILNVGVYIAVVTQGEYRKTVKLSKVN